MSHPNDRDRCPNCGATLNTTDICPACGIGLPLGSRAGWFHVIEDWRNEPRPEGIGSDDATVIPCGDAACDTCWLYDDRDAVLVRLRAGYVTAPSSPDWSAP